MNIIDINGKEREVKDLKIEEHTRINLVTVVKKENIDGELVDVSEDEEVETTEQFMKVIIIGRNSDWIEWYPLAKFEDMNPGVDINDFS